MTETIMTLENILPRSSPEAEGVSSKGLLAFLEAVDESVHDLHSFMLLRHGRVVAAGWWSPYASELPHMLFSLSKSFTSTAIGLAVAEGRLSVDDSIVSLLPNDYPQNASESLATLSVRHLLTMTSGHDPETRHALCVRQLCTLYTICHIAGSDWHDYARLSATTPLQTIGD